MIGSPTVPPAGVGVATFEGDVGMPATGVAAFGWGVGFGGWGVVGGFSDEGGEIGRPATGGGATGALGDSTGAAVPSWSKMTTEGTGVIPKQQSKNTSSIVGQQSPAKPRHAS